MWHKILIVDNDSSVKEWDKLPPNLYDDSSTDDSLFCGGFADGATRALAGAGRLLPLAVDEAADE